MARYRGRHRAPSTTGRTLARTAIAGAVLSAPALAAPSASADTGGTVWDRLAQCESSGNWAINTGNGFSGGLQFTRSTWRAFGGDGVAEDASREEQITVAERVLAKQGWGAWPACSRKLGLKGTPPKLRPAPQAKPSTSLPIAPPATPAPVAATAPAGGTFTVASGDTLSRIADRLHIDGGWRAIAAANPNIGNPHRLPIGTVLNLPAT